MKAKQKTPKTPAESPRALAANSAFDFELWAKQVRPQLLASVQKRLR